MKNTRPKEWLCLACCMVILGLMGCGGGATHEAEAEVHYLRYNFHYTTERNKVEGSVANYTSLPGHKILPYGSLVRVEPRGKTFNLIDEESGQKINVLAASRYLAGISLPEYFDLILSKTPVSYTDISEIDRKGISDGKPYAGMSKQGVMIALGYPCPHQTPSPDADEWYYWKNRFRSYAVNFENGIVVSSGY